MNAEEYILKVNSIYKQMNEEECIKGVCPLSMHHCGMILKEDDKTAEEKVREMVRIVEDYELPEEGGKYHTPLITTEKTACPFCDGINEENAVVVKDEQAQEYFVYCEKCMIETIESYKSRKSAIKAFADGKVHTVFLEEGE